jgi:hypothetical protein
MRFFLVSFLSLNFILGSSQSSKQLASLVSQLNNSQFIIEHGDRPSFSFESKAALKLIRKGKKAKVQLILALDDSSRAVMAQLVLCHIFFKQVSFAGPKIVSEGEYNINTYYLGEERGEGLLLRERKVNYEWVVYARKEDREKMKEYWRNK